MQLKMLTCAHLGIPKCMDLYSVSVVSPLVTLDGHSYAVLLPPTEAADKDRDTNSTSSVRDQVPELRDSDVASSQRVEPGVLHLLAPPRL